MVSTEFIAACKRLKDLDLSSENAVTLDVGVTEAMPATYEMPYRHMGKKTFNRSSGLLAKNRRGQWYELVQHLHDLRYITEAYFVAWHKRRAKDKQPLQPQMAHIYKGIAAYLAEEDYSLYKELAPFPGKVFSERTEWVEKHLSILVFRLSQFTSFDEEMAPPTGYRVGDQTIYGRSLLFRVRVLFAFGRDEFDKKTFFEAGLLKWLVSLNTSLGDPVRKFSPTKTTTILPPKFWDYLLSWDQLFKAFRKQKRDEAEKARNRNAFLLIYELENAEARKPIAFEKFKENKKEKKRERKKNKLEKNMKTKLDKSSLHADTGGNKLGIRLLQLGLWRSGFFVGEVNGTFDIEGHKALLELLDQEWETDKRIVKKDKLASVLLSGDEGKGKVWVADLRQVDKILEAYAPSSGEDADKEENDVWEKLNAANSGELNWEEKILGRRDAVNELYPAQQKNPLRRIYYGLRGLLRGAFRAIGKIVKWVVKGVGAVAGAIFSFLKATVKRIQEGIGLFFEGFRYFIHYLLGKPFITTGPKREDGMATICATRLAFDFDTTNVVSSDVTDEDIANHRATLRSLRVGLDFFMNTVGKILNFIGSLTTPVGWVRLGILIARLVRQVLQGAAKPSKPVLA
ncbi:MAG: hypothetical protein ACI92C_000210 [Neolewinella sp.]